MKLEKSVVTNLLFPASRNNIASFAQTMRLMQELSVDCAEFYHDGDGRGTGKVGNALADYGLAGIYIAVIPSKERQLWACSTDPENRAGAVRLFCDCLRDAADNGIPRMMINSGRIGDDPKAQYRCLGETVEQVANYAEQKGYHISLTMEPCDSRVTAMHLIGDYELADSFAAECRAKGIALELTMDSAHTAEQGQNFLDALRDTRPYCNHVHFANCCLSDPSSPLYGDQHVGYEQPNSVWNYEAIEAFWPNLEQLWPSEEPLRVTCEILCRASDPEAYFRNVWNRIPFGKKA